VEFRELEIPARCYPPGGNRHESWRTLFYANLVSSFIGEILSGGAENEGDFGDGAWVQEVINAVERFVPPTAMGVVAARTLRSGPSRASGPSSSTVEGRLKPDTTYLMLDRFFESYYRLRPVTATFTGIHEHDHRLPDWSPDGLAAAVDDMKALRIALEAARPPAASLHDVAERDRQLATSFLDIQIAEHESSGFQRGNPSLAVGEAIFGVISLMTRPFAPVAERAASAIARLTALPAFLDGARRSIAGPVPDAWRLKCLRECQGASMLLGDGIPKWIAAERIDGALAHHLSIAATGSTDSRRRISDVARARSRGSRRLRVRRRPVRSITHPRPLVRPVARQPVD
jgi:hypothetical protein